MATVRPSQPTSRKKIQVSYVMRDEVESKHRSGVNSIRFDPVSGRLYTACRDSIIRIWSLRGNKDPFFQSMEHHADWVNDIILCCGGRNMISASSDTTVKVWNAHKGFCMSTLRTHKDYVKTLCYAKEREQVASAGLDRQIYLWDVNTLTALTAANNTVTTCSLHGNKDSIYGLATNPSGTVIISGSTEKVLRVWDPRTCSKLMKLKGHTETVKTLVVNRDGTQCVSGSADGTIRLWSLGQQRCMTTIRVHEDGIWSLIADENFRLLFSAGRDRRVWCTSLIETECHTLVCEETAPILRLEFGAERESLWVATTDTSVRNWSIKNLDPMESTDSSRAFCLQPEQEIAGGASIRHYHVLNNKRHIVTKDSSGQVQLWDALQGTKAKELGPVDFEEEAKRQQSLVFVPSWFTVDLKMGMLTINLEENDCFLAWLSGKELQEGSHSDQKVNLGGLVLQGLLEHWPQANRSEEPKLVSFPGHTPIIFSEVGGRTLFRFLCKDAASEPEQVQLNENVPQWVADVVVRNMVPRCTKISFYLQAWTKDGKMVKRERLSASDILQVRKVIEHVYEKTHGATDATASGSTPPPGTTGAVGSEKVNDSATSEGSKLALDKVQLLCNEEVLDPDLDLRTVKHFIWKSGNDLILCYRMIK